jgi:hypothetical protein
VWEDGGGDSASYPIEVLLILGAVYSASLSWPYPREAAVTATKKGVDLL